MVTTSTPNRQSQIVAKIYTFLKKKKNFCFNVYSSCPGWLYAFNPHRNPEVFSFLSPVYRQDSKAQRGHVSSLSSRGGGTRQECVGIHVSNNGVICLWQLVPMQLLLLKRERIKYKPSHSQYSLLKSKTKASNPHSFSSSH